MTSYINTREIKCRNNYCNNVLKIELNNAENPPVIFCGNLCLQSFLLSKDISIKLDYQNPNEINKLVQSVISQKQIIEKELEHLKKIRKTYFDLFKNVNLKRETYIRDWSFKDEEKE